jgi:hypothetical protein
MSDINLHSVKKEFTSKYSYTPSIHIKSMLSDISLPKKTITQEKFVPREIIDYIEKNLDNTNMPTIKDIRKILYKSKYKNYVKYMPEIINKLSYKVPIITTEQKEQIVKYFEEHKDKFIKTKTPLTYYNFNEIINHIIYKLDFDINLIFLENKMINIK